MGKIAMPNSRFGYSVKKNSFKGLNIDCVQYSNIIRITYYSYSYSGTILNPNIIRIRIRPNIIARILFIFEFAHSEKTNNIRIRIWSKKQYSLTSAHRLSWLWCFVITNILRFFGVDLNVAWYASPYQSYKGIMRAE